MPTPQAVFGNSVTKVSSLGVRSKLLSFVLVFVFACISKNAFSLGLGEMQVSSVINEPLAATIPVLNSDGVEQSELILALASASDYQLAGVSWEFAHTELQFEAAYAVNGDLVIHVTTERAIREPYLNFLVQARWPAGRLLREYTVLLDFPVFTGEQTNSSAVASASEPASSQTAVSQAAPEPVVQSVVAPPAPAPAQAPVTRQATSAPRIVSGTDSNSSPEPIGDGDYRIQNGDTLWSVGGRVAQNMGVSRHQAMLAIREANPEAFAQGNLNMLRSGSLIRMPGRNQTLSRTATQAASEFAQAMASDGQLYAEATPLQSRATDFREDAGSDQNSGGQFRLTSAEQSSAANGGNGLAQVESENQLLSDQNAALQEQLDASEIQNRDLTDRLRNLEEQISVMEALIEVESDEIRAVQEAVTAPEPVVNPIASVYVQEETLVSKILGWLPIVGLVLVGLLVGAYLLIRRRNAAEDSEELAGFDEEYDEDAAVYADEPVNEQVPSIDDDLDEADQTAGFMLDDESDAEDDLLELPEDSGEIAEFDLESGTDAAEENSDADEEDWTSDFDDLDAFFDDVDDSSEAGSVSGEENSDEPDSEDLDPLAVAGFDESASDQDDDESESEKTQIFDASTMAGMAAAAAEKTSTDEEAFTSEEQSLDPAEDDDDLESMDFESFDIEEDEQDLDISVDEDEDSENILDFSLDEEDITSFDDSDEDEGLEEDDEFSVDFDLDGEDFSAEGAEDEEADTDSSADEDMQEENTLAFDVSDMDLSSSSLAEAAELPETDSELASEEADQPASEEDSEIEDTDLEDLNLDDFDLNSDSAESEDVDTSDSENSIDLSDADEAEDDLDSLLVGLEDDLDTEISGLGDESDSTDDEEDLSDFDLDLSDDLTDETETETETDLDSMLEDDKTADGEEDLLGDFAEDGFDLSDLDNEVTDSDEDTDIAEECETKLELASAYIEMGDSKGAKELLEEVISEGTESYKAKATELLESLS